MKVEARVLHQPALNGRSLVSTEVVDDDMNFELLRHLLLDLAKEGSQVLGAVLCVALADHVAGSDVEGGKQVGRSVPDVVVRSTLGPTEVHGQDWLSPFKRLNLRLLVDTKDDRVVWRAHVEPDDVA